MPPEFPDGTFAEFEEGDGEPDLFEDGFDSDFLQLLQASPIARDPQMRWDELSAVMEGENSLALLRSRLGVTPDMLMSQDLALEDEILAMEFEEDAEAFEAQAQPDELELEGMDFEDEF
jgi:hypothetical protein